MYIDIGYECSVQFLLEQLFFLIDYLYISVRATIDENIILLASDTDIITFYSSTV